MSDRRKSKQSEMILEILKGTKAHPDADWIYERVRERIPKISLGTVYRNLSRMSETGEILKLDVNTGTSHYDANVCPHCHVVCRECGRIDDLTEEVPEFLFSEARKIYRGRIIDCSVIYYGFCESCS